MRWLPWRYPHRFKIKKTQNRSFTLFEIIPFWKNNHLGNFGILCFCWNRFSLRFQVGQQISTSSIWRQMDGWMGYHESMVFWGGVQTPPRHPRVIWSSPSFRSMRFFFLVKKIGIRAPNFKPQSWDEFKVGSMSFISPKTNEYPLKNAATGRRSFLLKSNVPF